MPPRLIEKLKDKLFRSSFVSAQVRRIVSTQIKALRESFQWTQAELGKRAGMKPNAISRLESPEYGDFTINTLLRLAKAFDVGLIVRFAAFSELADWNQKVSPQSYTPPSFDEDRTLRIDPTPVLAEHQKFYRSHWQQVPTFESADMSISVEYFWSVSETQAFTSSTPINQRPN